ncbi:hypothetical protein [Oceanobacillus massiliensis]|uniref:hypothetical protein n=1 Tax=Oceanobacillus massiliensis TaxID=1465765 RepID=UPI000288025A|nr:hypothetical protein [Oceanobacillus massiliensis]
METLPNWFWIIYCIYILLTLSSGIINWVRQVYSPLAAITIIFSLLVPLVSFVYGVSRTEGLNEFQYIIAEFRTGSYLAVFIVMAHLYLIAWWFIFLDAWTYLKKTPQYINLLIDKVKNIKKERADERSE